MKRAQTLVGVAPPPSDRALAAERALAAPVPQPSSSRLALSPLDAHANAPPSSRGVLDIAAPMGEPVTEDPNLAVRSPFAVPSKLDDARAKASELVSSLTPTQKKIAAAAGGGGFLFLFITVIAVSCGGPSKESAERAAAAAGSSAGMQLDVPPRAAFTAPTSTVASESPKEPPRTTGAPFPDGVWPSIVEIVGDAPIAYVKVEGRPTDILAPTPRVNVELEPGEDSHDVHVFAQTNDGRTATGIVKPGGTLNLAFANAPVRPAQPPPPPPQKGWKGRGKK
jgi:hypothetical protein